MKSMNIVLSTLIAVLYIATNAFSAQFTFSPRTRADATYTDNLDRTKDGREDDFIILLSAGFTAELLGKTSGMQISSEYGYAFYEQNNENDTSRIPINFKAWTSPSQRTTYEFTNTFIRTEEPQEDNRLRSDGGRVEESGDTTVRKGRDTYYRNTATLTGTYQFGQQDKVYANLRYGLLRNDDDITEDNDEYRASAGLDYSFTYRFGSQFFGEFTRGEFDTPSDFEGDGSSDFDSWRGSLTFNGRMTRHFSWFFQYGQSYRSFDSDDQNDYVVYAPSAGFNYIISEDAFLRLGLGYFYQDVDNENSQENPFINSQVSNTWNYQRGSINLTGLAGLTQNDFGAQRRDFQQFASIQSKANYSFTRRITGDTSASIRYSITPGATDDTDGGEDIKDTNAQFNAGLAYLPTRWMNIRLGYTFNYYHSNEDEDFYENRALLTITLQPDQPWRF